MSVRVLFAVLLLGFGPRSEAAELVWLEAAGGSGIFEQGNAVATDDAGGVFLTGYFEHAARFGFTTLTEFSGETVDGFLARYRSDGSLDWVRQLAGMGNVSGDGVAAGAAGNSVVGGSLSGRCSISGLLVDSGSTGSRAFVAGFDAPGQAQWLLVNESEAEFPGFAGTEDVALDGQGSVLATGWFNQGFTLGSTEIVAEGADEDVWIAKITADGAPAWLRHGRNVEVGGPYRRSRGTAVAAGSGDDAWATGWVEDATEFEGEVPPERGGDDVFLVRYDSGGGREFLTRAGGGGRDRAYGVTVDAAGNVYVVGSFSGTAGFGDETLVSVGGSDAFIWKLDSDGNHLWAVRAGGPGGDEFRGIDISADGELRVAGRVQNGGDFGELMVDGAAEFVAGYANDGTALWIDVSTSGDLVLWDLAAQGEEIYVAASFRLAIEWSGLHLVAESGQDILLGHFRANARTAIPRRRDRGVRLWVESAHPSAGPVEFAYCLPSAQRVRLSVHDLRGALVRVLEEAVHGAGSAAVVWDGRDGSGIPVAAGVYIGRLETAHAVVNARVIRVR